MGGSDILLVLMVRVTLVGLVPLGVGSFCENTQVAAGGKVLAEELEHCSWTSWLKPHKGLTMI